MVDVVSDANYGPIGYTGEGQEQRVNLGAMTACISNVYFEDRSGDLKPSSELKMEEKKDNSVGSAIKAQQKELRQLKGDATRAKRL